MRKILHLKQILLLVILSITLVACGTKIGQDKRNDQTTIDEKGKDKEDEKREELDNQDNRPTKDRVGNDIIIPEEVNRIISLAPSTSIILNDLGMMDKIVAVDTYTPSNMKEEISWDGILQFDMMTPDLEQILVLEPDVIFTTSMSNAGGDDIFLSLRNAGICVIEIPSSSSIEEIKVDIQFIGACVNQLKEADKLVEEMEKALDEIEAIGNTIQQKKTVFFEVSAAPYSTSFGKGVFLHDMIELIGAVNALEKEKGWIGVTEEAVVLANPDVILTNVNYLEDPIEELLSREGLKEVKAVVDKEIYYIDNSASSLPNHNIIQALKEMAQAIYPEYYKTLEE